MSVEISVAWFGTSRGMGADRYEARLQLPSLLKAPHSNLPVASRPPRMLVSMPPGSQRGMRDPPCLTLFSLPQSRDLVKPRRGPGRVFKLGPGFRLGAASARGWLAEYPSTGCRLLPKWIVAWFRIQTAPRGEVVR